MRLREHRGGLGESLATTVDVEDRTALVALIAERLAPYGVEVTDGMVSVEPYGFDGRTGRDDHVVKVDGYGVFGFTDAPCPSAATVP